MIQLRITLLALAVASVCGAQVPAISLGLRLRIEHERGKKVEGKAILQTTDSVVIAVFNAVRIAVPTATITRIQVSAGNSRVRGALQGIKIGGIAGIALGFLLYAEDSAKGDTALGASLAAGVVTGALFGAPIGALLPSVRWTTLYSRPARLAFHRGADGQLGAGLAIRF